MALFFYSAVLSSEERQRLFNPVLPTFVRFCKAFPPLVEDVVGLLLQYGRITASENSSLPLSVDQGLIPVKAENFQSSGSSPRHTMDLVNGFGHQDDFVAEIRERLGDKSNAAANLPQPVLDVFEKILTDAVLEKRLY